MVSVAGVGGAPETRAAPPSRGAAVEADARQWCGASGQQPRPGRSRTAADRPAAAGGVTEAFPAFPVCRRAGRGSAAAECEEAATLRGGRRSCGPEAVHRPRESVALLRRVGIVAAIRGGCGAVFDRAPRRSLPSRTPAAATGRCGPASSAPGRPRPAASPRRNRSCTPGGREGAATPPSSRPTTPPNTQASCSADSLIPNADARLASGSSCWITESRQTLASDDAVDPTSPTIGAVVRPGIRTAISVVDAARDQRDDEGSSSGCSAAAGRRVALPTKPPIPAARADHPEQQQLGEALARRRTRS